MIVELETLHTASSGIGAATTLVAKASVAITPTAIVLMVASINKRYEIAEHHGASDAAAASTSQGTLLQLSALPGCANLSDSMVAKYGERPLPLNIRLLAIAALVRRQTDARDTLLSTGALMRS